MSKASLNGFNCDKEGLLVTVSHKEHDANSDSHASTIFFLPSCFFWVYFFFFYSFARFQISDFWIQWYSTLVWKHWGERKSRSSAAEGDKQGHKSWSLSSLQPMFQGAVISGRINWGRVTEEVLWGQDTQLFQTHSHQLLFFFFHGEAKEEWRAKTPLQACTTRGGLMGGGLGQGDNEAASLLPPLSYGPVYSWITELGPHCKCAVQTTPDKCSVWLLAAQTNRDPISNSLT